MNQSIADKVELTELANKLFMYTDAQQWQQLLDDVFVKEVWFDASSAGAGEPGLKPAGVICDMWRQGFTELDAVHHQAGHYIITVHADDADIYAYAVATHYKKSAVNSKSRTFIGSYNLKAERTENGWRLNQFKYNLKFIDGNAGLV